MSDNFKKAYEFFVSKTGKEISQEEFKELLLKTLNRVSEYSLESVSGGAKGKNITSALLIALNIMLPSVAAEDSAFHGLSAYNEYIESPSTYVQKDSVVKYFTEAKISNVQEKVFKITNEYFQKYSNECPHICLLREISSLRYLDNQEQPTKIEKILDEAVKENDLPLQSFKLNEIRDIKQRYRSNPDIHPIYIFEVGGNVLNLHKTAMDEAIVQVASQYNSLESVNTDFSPVVNWFWDKTQGPMACLQALAATKHRESAAIQGKLPDIIKDLLDDCIVTSKELGGLIKSNVKITEKYPNLYKNGYFRPSVIEKENLSDLRKLSAHIKKNIGKLGFNSQWVKCEGSSKKQLQVFNAAPSFQGDHSWLRWDDKDDPRVVIYKEICENLVVEQYRSIAQVAAIKSCESGRQEELHIYQVGQGAFYNPPEIMSSVLKVIKDELEGFNVKVYLHSGRGGNSKDWKSIMMEI